MHFSKLLHAPPELSPASTGLGLWNPIRKEKGRKKGPLPPPPQRVTDGFAGCRKQRGFLPRFSSVCGRFFGCLLSGLATHSSRPAKLPTAKAGFRQFPLLLNFLLSSSSTNGCKTGYFNTKLFWMCSNFNADAELSPVMCNGYAMLVFSAQQMEHDSIPIFATLGGTNISPASLFYSSLCHRIGEWFW